MRLDRYERGYVGAEWLRTTIEGEKGRHANEMRRQARLTKQEPTSQPPNQGPATEGVLANLRNVHPIRQSANIVFLPLADGPDEENRRLEARVR